MDAHDVRVVITGVGAVTPAGLTVDTTFAAVLSAQSAVSPITAWDTTDHPVRFAATINDFDPSSVLPPREARRVDRVSQFGLMAAEEALGQAGLISGDDDGVAAGSGVDGNRVGVVMGTGVGGITTLEDQIAVRVTRGVERVGPLLIPMMMANATSGLVALRHGFHGPALSVATACASGVDSIGRGVDLLRTGRADVVVVGGTEASITPTAMAAFARMGALSRRNDDPQAASRPFDCDRDGFVMGEGAGALVIETEEHARRRGATVLGEVAGYGSTCDAHHMTAPDPEGSGATSCMRQALIDAGLEPDAITHVNAHGTSTPLNDAAESMAMLAVFGGRTPPVTSAKGVIGHLVGATGAVEVILALESARRGIVPPIANLDKPDVDPAVDLVQGEPRSIPVGPALSNSFGFGGHNASLVVVPA